MMVYNEPIKSSKALHVQGNIYQIMGTFDMERR